MGGRKKSKRAASPSDSDSSREAKGDKASNYVRARTKAIGSVVDPKLGDELKAFIALMLVQNPFREITDPVRRAEILERLNAILADEQFVRWLDAVTTNNGEIDDKSPEYQREAHFLRLNEVRVLMALVFNARAGRPSPNADGLYAANRATAQEMQLTTGGLTQFLQFGAPSPVTVLVQGRRALMATQGHTAAPHQAVAPQHAGPALHHPVAAPFNPPAPPGQQGPAPLQRPGGPRPREVCGYCGKLGHAAAMCRTRRQHETPPAPTAAPATQTEEDRMKTAFAAYLKSLPK